MSSENAPEYCELLKGVFCIYSFIYLYPRIGFRNKNMKVLYNILLAKIKIT